jgi:hypothetical protein
MSPGAAKQRGLIGCPVFNLLAVWPSYNVGRTPRSGLVKPDVPHAKSSTERETGLAMETAGPSGYEFALGAMPLKWSASHDTAPPA